MSETEVIEAAGTIDYAELLDQIVMNTAFTADFLRIVTGILIFFVVVVLCYFAYKFFRIFI